MIKRRLTKDVLRDPEVIELLRNEPELLAIADTIHATLGARYRRRRARARIARVVLVAAVLSAAAVLALVQPWSNGGHGLVADALAAIPGTGPVVHTVIESSVPGVEIVNLRTGDAEPERLVSTFWFDPRRDLLHTLVRRNGTVIVDTVAAPDATAVGRAFGQPSSLDPGLVAFASGYRAALASGTARPVPRTKSGGGTGPTLEVTTPLGRERVALNALTLHPVEIRPLRSDGTASARAVRVVLLSSQPAAPGQFQTRFRPARLSPSGGAVQTSTRVQLAQAAHALPGGVLWAGARLSGLPLQLIASQQLSPTSPSDARKKQRGVGVDLVYGAGRADSRVRRSRFLEIQQALKPEPAYGFLPGRLRIEPLPGPGFLLLERRAGEPGRALWRAELKRNGLYLALTASSRELVLAGARELRPIPRS